MPLVKYRTSSPYAATKQTSWYLDLYQKRDIRPADDDLEITIKSQFHQRPDLLSHHLYQTPNYFWIFAARNMDLIVDPIYDLRAGLSIVVPSKQHLERLR